MVDGQSLGAGPGLFCQRCGLRDGAPGFERICGDEVRQPMGVKSDYDPMA